MGEERTERLNRLRDSIGSDKNKFRWDYLPFGKPNFGPEEMIAITNCMRSGWVGMGNETIEFEKELAAYVNAPKVLSLNTCTSALHLSLLISGVKEGDEVIVPSLTWCSTANAAMYINAKPVFADIDPENFCITPETIKAKITPKTKAVIVVHYGGYAQNVDEIKKILPPGVALIEDAAHALGSLYPDGKKVGSRGNLTCFSFYANKNLSTGEGGAIAVFDDNDASGIESLRMHSLSGSAWKRFVDKNAAFDLGGLQVLGYKMNYTDLQACIGRVQLRRQKEFAEIRQQIASYYYDEIEKAFPGQIKFQKDILEKSHAKHLFVILLPVEKMKISRNEFLLKMRQFNIGASIHYHPLHKMPLYNAKDSLKNTESFHERCLTLPISASMSMLDAKSVIDTFREVFSNSLK